MSAVSTGPAPMMTLRDLVQRYLSIAHAFGRLAPLSAFSLSRAETERLFSSNDEDYHISRFFQFSDAEGEKFSINGTPATHVALSAEIESIL